MASSPNSRGMVQKGIRLSKTVKEEIKTLAPLEGRSANNLIIKMLREGIAKRRRMREQNNG